MHWQPKRQAALSLHTQIVTWFTDNIRSGDFPPGMKCPPQRVLAVQFGVNRSTVHTAMEELQANGLIESIVGKGTFICADPWQALLSQPKWQRYIDTSIHKPNMDTIQLINDYEQRSDMIRLGTGELATTLLPTASLEQSLAHITLSPRALGYSEPQGSIALREALCVHLQKRGIHTTPRNILIVSGALQALQLIALGLLERGSLVFHEEASYLQSIHPFQSAGMQLLGRRLTQIDKPSMQAMLQTRQGVCYVMPTLHNPTGYSWSEAEKQTFYTMCQQLSLPIIEDDVYEALQFDGTSTRPLKANDRSGHVLYIGSISKALSAGLRIGWIVAPEAVIQRLADVKMQTDYGSSALSQAVVTHWLTSGLYDASVDTLRQQLQQRARYTETLLHMYLRDVASWQSPTGGYYIWLRFHEPVIQKSLFLQLIQRGVLINPGYMYQPNDFHHIRLSFSYASEAELKTGIQLLSQLVNEALLSQKKKRLD